MKTLFTKVGQKIKALRVCQNLRVDDAHKKGITLLGAKSISPATMYRIESGDIAKLSSLEQYLFILGSDLKNIIEGTELDELLIFTKNERLSGFTYSKNAFSTIINNPNQKFLSQEVFLKPSGKTDLDYASKDKAPSHKFIYIVQGDLTCFINKKKYTLKHRGVLSFDSTKEHYFVNNGNCDCIFVMVESPGRY